MICTGANTAITTALTFKTQAQLPIWELRFLFGVAEKYDIIFKKVQPPHPKCRLSG